MTRLHTGFKLFVAAMCLAAQVLVLGHYALVEHTRCEEHGALVHAGAHDAHVVSVESDGVEPTDAVRSGEAAHDDGHDHCATTSERRKAVCAAAPIAITQVALTSQRTLAVAYVSRVGRAVHWIAPKTSPPV